MSADSKTSSKNKNHYIRTVRKYRPKSPRSILKTTKNYHQEKAFTLL